MRKWLAALLVILPMAACAEETYYVNPDGGRYIHTERTCATVREVYQAQMEAIPAEKLMMEPYASMPMCNICSGKTTQPAEVTFYSTPYDTAPAGISLTEAGTYAVGDQLPTGLYSIMAQGACASPLRLILPDGRIAHEFHFNGATNYTVYLAEGMKIDLPAGCILESFAEVRYFQQQGKTEVIAQLRGLTMEEIPGSVYMVTGRNGGGSVMLEWLGRGNQHIPLRIDLAAGECISLSLQGQDDVLVEIVNCDVCPEVGEG